MQYRRTDVAGATYFFTVNLAERRKSLLTDHIDTLRAVVNSVHAKHPFHIDAMVVLPDHLHAIWTLPAGEHDYSIRWNLIKGGFSRKLPRDEYRRDSRIKKRERGIWQRRYWEHMIRDERDFIHHVNYIHFNPVKHGHVRRAVDWPYSSIHRYIRQGILDANWGESNGLIDKLDCGEF